MDLQLFWGKFSNTKFEIHFFVSKYFATVVNCGQHCQDTRILNKSKMISNLDSIKIMILSNKDCYKKCFFIHEYLRNFRAFQSRNRWLLIFDLRGFRRTKKIGQWFYEIFSHDHIYSSNWRRDTIF